MEFKGAEAFITNHRWKDNVRRFINIDSIGGNEKAILFRVKPSQVYLNHSFLPYQFSFFLAR